MCMSDDADRVTPINDGEYRKARKPHKCQECRREIAVGETYHYETFRNDGRFEQHKTCSHCMVVRDWLSAECGGWVYTMVEEDIREHADYHGLRVKLLAVGMARNWRRKDGRMWPLPKMPKTTHDTHPAQSRL